MKDNFLVDIQIAHSELSMRLKQWLKDCVQLELGHSQDAHLHIWDMATFRYQRQLGQPVPLSTVVLDETYEADHEREVLMSGALDYAHQQLPATNLILRLSLHVQRLEHVQKLESLSITDNLTGVFNRRKYDEDLDRCWRQSIRQQTPCTLLLLDVDHFKVFNDTYGHLAGDQCLREIAKVFQEEAVRPHDTVARIGGEEFAIILPDTPKIGAVHVANRILKRVSSLGILNEETPFGVVTLSAGIACVTPTAKDRLVNFQSHADDALYEAKAKGRNCVVSEVSSSPHIFAD
ncbi:GGDEF domain-containing protein [Bermanella marisrubri]|uniref:diguanylate cyclase n=1 Tax=Bermanella marisrubri TaxID=207949 RepID=Q1N188_9GAMM|nr:GGDEF domain-containing protein [Bermanella marisrubri]EAT11963.1 response regulator [Oceanobacter sp. RED65] [Bermanella marisrubri]QIZ84767.1 GGDEF domain-containing protein [Bermanella marisrubri]